MLLVFLQETHPSFNFPPFFCTGFPPCLVLPLFFSGRRGYAGLFCIVLREVNVPAPTKCKVKSWIGFNNAGPVASPCLKGVCTRSMKQRPTVRPDLLCCVLAYSATFGQRTEVPVSSQLFNRRWDAG